jgi:hypothetical protein
MILNKKLNKRIYDNKISGKKYEEEIDQYSDYEVDQLTRTPHSNLKENDSMSNGTKTSSLVTHTLQGGWDNTRMVFTINPTNGYVMIRHHTDRNNPEKFIENFHIDIDGKDTVIQSDTQYTTQFARKVWNLFVDLDKKIARNKWTRVD